MTEIDATTKATIYADAVIDALHHAGVVLGAPDINAALSALTFTQAYLIAKITDRNVRRQAVNMCVKSLEARVVEQVNARILREMGQEAGR